MDASLVHTSPAEPINAMPERAKPSGHWRMEIHPADRAGVGVIAPGAPAPPQKGLSVPNSSPQLKSGVSLGCFYE